MTLYTLQLIEKHQSQCLSECTTYMEIMSCVQLTCHYIFRRPKFNKSPTKSAIRKVDLKGKGVSNRSEHYYNYCGTV